MQLDEQRILGQELRASLGSVVCNATSLHAYFLLAKQNNSWIWSYIPTYIIFFSCISFHSFLHHMVFSHGFSLNLSTPKWLVYVNGWKKQLSNRWSYIDFDPSHCGYLVCMHPIFFSSWKSWYAALVQPPFRPLQKLSLVHFTILFPSYSNSKRSKIEINSGVHQKIWGFP